MTMRRLVVLVCSACVLWTASARADVVTDWNAVTILYVVGSPPAVPVGRMGPPALVDVALVHLAMHDAIQSIEGRFKPYHYFDPSKLGSGSPAAAAAAAAHRVLVLLFPGQQGPLDTVYNNYLVDHGLVGDPALAVGEAAAQALYASHYKPILPVVPFFGISEPGQWRSGVAMAFQYLAVSTPFTLKRISQFRPPPPPPMSSTRYVREFEEVEALGRSTAHPNATTDVARFWSANYVPQWNEALRRISDIHLSDISDSGRLFALANMAAADAAMAVWEAKIFYNFWRPSTAIQLADTDGNPRTAPDAMWTGLIADPAYPDYVSGANGLTGAFTGLLEQFFGTDVFSFSVKTTNALSGTPERFFTRFSQAADEVVNARIYLGIHFRSADEEGRRLGTRVAHWAFQNFLRPMPGHP